VSVSYIVQVIARCSDRLQSHREGNNGGNGESHIGKEVCWEGLCVRKWGFSEICTAGVRPAAWGFYAIWVSPFIPKNPSNAGHAIISRRTATSYFSLSLECLTGDGRRPQRTKCLVVQPTHQNQISNWDRSCNRGPLMLFRTDLVRRLCPSCTFFQPEPPANPDNHRHMQWSDNHLTDGSGCGG
jgi:hypothetical protein